MIKLFLYAKKYITPYLSCRFKGLSKNPHFKFLTNERGEGVVQWVLLAVIFVIIIFALGKALGPQIYALIERITNTFSESSSETWE